MHQDKRGSNFRSIQNIILIFVFLLSLSLPPQGRAKATFYPTIKATPYMNTPIMGQTELNLGVYLEGIDVGSVGGYFRLKLYSPNDPTCTGDPFFADNIIFIESNSIYNLYMIPNTTSNLYSLPKGPIVDKTGIWNWVVEFNSGDNNRNQSTNTNCGDITVPVYPKAGTAPQVKLQLSPFKTTVQKGDTVTAQMYSPNLSPYANGTVDYKLFKDPYCLGNLKQKITKNYTTLQVNNGKYTGGFFEPSGNVTYTEAGIFGWKATYSGDESTASATTPCYNVEVLEPNTYQKTALPYTAPIGSALNASITRTGSLPDPNNPNGSFQLYGPSDPTCSGSPIYTQSVSWFETVPGTYVAATSPGYTPTNTGTYNWIINGSNCADIPVEVVAKKDPTLDLQFSSAQTFNLSVPVTSLLTGSTENASGTLTYYQFSSNNCTGTPQQINQISFLSMYSYTQTAAFPALGNYSWRAQYSGDASNNSATSNCAAVQIIAPVTTTLSLQVSTPSASLTGSTLVVSSPVYATASLGNNAGNASGLVTYYLYEGNTCADEDMLRVLNSVSIENSVIPQSKSAYFYGVEGTVYFQARYWGDSTYQSAVSNCVAVDIVKADPTVTLGLSAATGNEGAQVSAQGSITNGAGLPAGNEFTFKVYTDSACTIEYATPVVAGNNGLVGFYFPYSSAVTFNEPGKYYWRLFYAGNSATNPASSNCSSNVLTITPAQPTLFVASNGVSSGTCASWANACTLQYAFSIAKFGHSIWVKAGTYTPHASDRAVSFQLKNGIAIYGGFAGTETQLSQRNPAVNVTILSGDLNGNDGVNFANNTENSYHVVVGSGTDNSAKLDGFTITGGNANGGVWPHYNGGGIINYQGNPTLQNLTIAYNKASNGGGGMINDTNSNIDLSHLTFIGNSAGTAGGGGVLNWNVTNLKLSNVTFYTNSTTGSGGGLIHNSGDQTIVNVTFSSNSATVNGDNLAITGGTSTVKNTILANGTNGKDCTGTLTSAANNLIEATGSSACGLTNGSNGNVIGSDPSLGSLTGSPAYLPLNTGSPAVDAGDNTVCAAAPVNNSSQNGVTRPFGTQCDIGSFEANPTPLPTGWVGSVSVTSDKNLVSVGRPHIGSEVASYDGFASGSTNAFVPMLFKDAFGGDYDAALYIQNVSGSSASVTIQYYDSSGVLNCTKADTIAPLASKGYWLPAATCDTGSLPTGWVGGVKVTSNHPIVAVGRPHIGSEVMTYNGFSSGSTSAFIPMLFKGAFGGSYNAAFYVQNVSGSSANVTLEYFDNTGTLNCTKSDTIASLASKGYWLPAATCDTGSLPAGWVGGVRVSSSQPVVTVGRPHIDTQITTYDGFSAGANSAYVPMLFKGAFGGSYNAAFYLQNVSNSSASVTIKYYDNAGTLNCTKADTIAPLASKGYWLPAATCDTGSLPAGWVGGVEVTSDQPIVSVGRPHIDAQVTTYNGFTAGAVSAFLPMLFKDAFGGEYDSAFYLQNTEASEASVTIQFFDNTGTLTCSRTDTIQPRATLGFWVPSVTCFP